MNIDNFLKTAQIIPPQIAILMRGPTGIGKSHLVKSIAKNLNLPLIDVRGSTMSEGDVGGYPDIDGMKEHSIMTFVMPSWFIRSCQEPVVLFLDELNRSLPGVQQSFFQLVLDRELGNDASGMPYKLHPDTRVFAAVNHGSEYDVNEMDPALLRRFWVCDIENTVDNWLAWGTENGISPYILEFIKKFPKTLRVDPATVEPGKTIPCQASWARIDDTLKYAKINLEDMLGKPKNKILFPLLSGFVGPEAAIEFVDFIEKYKVSISAEDILNSYDSVKDKLTKISNDRINSLIDQISTHAKSNDWSVSQAINVEKFAKSINQEMVVHFWSMISKCDNIENIKLVHKYLGNYIIEIVKESKDFAKN